MIIITTFEGIDYGFRPESYWNVTDPLHAILVNVQGTQRREMICDYWKAGRIEELADAHLLDVLDEETRERLGKIHPAFMGGEYLPAYEPGQVEIARIEIKSMTGDVISIRAKKSEPWIFYSIADEYEQEFIITEDHSEKPATLLQLIALIDGARNTEGGTLIQYQLGADFTRVVSLFYPQLSAHYEQRLAIRLPDNPAT
jgi:hypothetical protein